ncbi:MAG: flagellar biosynthesis protein FlhB [Gammaproteobacteria bacterium]|nr:flagellar biosynthesis protein FlhB [Gammaproteobacteria bacterium]
MSETDAAERTLEPSSKRLEDARRRGDVPRSADLTTAIVSVVAVTALWFVGATALEALAGLMRAGLEWSPFAWRDPDGAVKLLGSSMRAAIVSLLPWFSACIVAAGIAPTLLGGWNFSTETLRIDFARIDPLAGFGRVFSSRALLELSKNVIKVIVVSTIALLILRTEAQRISALAWQDIDVALHDVCRLLGASAGAMTLALSAIAVVDAPWQWWSHRRRLRMTHDELRQEYRESEGTPETRARLRDAQRAIARGRMLEEVPNASVVVTNPTHYAVALRYDAARDGAPIVVAKGADALAATIRGVAERHAIPLVSMPPLARVLYRHVDIGAGIPPRLYTAVAQVLTYVWQVERLRRTGRGATPTVPTVDPDIESWSAR